MPLVDVTILAIVEGERKSAPAKLNTTTFEVTVEDTEFTTAQEGKFDGFYLLHPDLYVTDEELLPVGVDYFGTGNEFMIVDGGAVASLLELIQYDNHEDEEDFEDFDDGTLDPF